MQTTSAPAPKTTQAPSVWARAARAAARTPAAIWKFLAGAALCQNFLPSILVVGWTLRLSQRAVLKQWWTRSEPEEGKPSFARFLAGGPYHRGHAHWPNWILEQNRAWLQAPKKPGFSKIPAAAKALLHSLWLNLKIGVQGLFNVWVFTMPGCVVMLFAWYAGWHNSFNKGYEQAAVGPATGLLGIFLFIAAMFYVPIAQLRQASTGDWRAFYQFRVVWTLIRKRWIACLGLALLYSAVSVPVTVLKIVPGFFPQINPALVELPPVEALKFAKTYFFYSAFLVFPAFVLLRLAAARIYAGSVVACVQSGALAEESLAENEWEALHRLELLRMRPRPARHPVVQTITWFGTKLGRATIGTAIFLAWFTFVAQVYVAEFFNRSEYSRGWLNQPLVQLPWFNYTPDGLEAAAREAAPKP